MEKGEIMSKFKTNEEYFAFAKRLVVIPVKDISDLLDKSRVNLPDFVHRFLLKETIRSKVFEDKLYTTYTDEIKYRLRGYEDFSIFLLERFIEKYNLDFEVTRYKELLFKFLFLNRDLLRLSKNFVNELQQLQHNYSVDLEVMDYPAFMELFKPLFHSVDGYIDGIKIERWTDDMLASYTLGDLKGMAMKYDVKIPRRINKTKLVEILAAKFRLSESEKEEIAKESVLDLEIYAKEKGFMISIDLKKSDMIEYLKYSLGLYHKEPYHDSFDYHIPVTTAVEDIEKDMAEPEIEVSEEPEVTPVPIQEEVEEVAPEEPASDEVEEPAVAKPQEPEVIEETEEENEFANEPVLEDIIIDEEEDIEVKEPEAEEPVAAEPEPEEPEAAPAETMKPAFIDDKTEPKPEVPYDESLLSKEEKELLDEKINIIIKKFYRKRRRRRIILISIFVVVIAAAIGLYLYNGIFGLL